MHSPVGACGSTGSRHRSGRVDSGNELNLVHRECCSSHGTSKGIEWFPLAGPDGLASIFSLFAIRSVPYFEYVESKADWANEISREGAQGSWAPCNAFSVKGCRVVVKLLKHPSLAVFLIFKHSQES